MLTESKYHRAVGFAYASASENHRYEVRYPARHENRARRCCHRRRFNGPPFSLRLASGVSLITRTPNQEQIMPMHFSRRVPHRTALTVKRRLPSRQRTARRCARGACPQAAIANAIQRSGQKAGVRTMIEAHCPTLCLLLTKLFGGATNKHTCCQIGIPR
jgi:hypothetical protein